MRMEEEATQKKKEMAEKLIKENEKLTRTLTEVDRPQEDKISKSQIKNLKEELESGEKNVKITAKKNKDKIKEKEDQLKASKEELKALTEELGELSKVYRVNQYRISQYDRTLKYRLYDPNRSMVESQLDLSQGSKSGIRYLFLLVTPLIEHLQANTVVLNMKNIIKPPFKDEIIV